MSHVAVKDTSLRYLLRFGDGKIVSKELARGIKLGKLHVVAKFALKAFSE